MLNHIVNFNKADIQISNISFIQIDIRGIIIVLIIKKFKGDIK